MYNRVIQFCMYIYKHVGKPSGAVVKNPHVMPETIEMWIRFLSQEDPLEKEMATHSSIFAWKVPQTEEPGGLQS